MLTRKTPFAALLLATALVASTGGCDTKRRVDTALDNANKLATEYQRLGKNLNATIEELRAAAKQPVSTPPVSVARVPSLPATVTGGVDTASKQTGTQGTASVNIDGVGGNENVTAFVSDAADGAASVTYVAWEGDEESEDSGVCYLAWENQSALWFVASACDQGEGAFVCQLAGEEVACSACNTAGECNACDLESENFECSWPGAEGEGEPPVEEEQPPQE